MQAAQLLGGYSLGSADMLRRAMGKKKPEEMAQQRGIFKEGAAKNGLTAAKADEIFDLMEKFAGYGFNKSHAAAYALVAYQTAYMKTHHLAAFMAANLSAVLADTDKVQVLYDDAKDQGLEIIPPDINASEYRFVPLDDKRIAYGLGAVKGTGEQAIESVVAARKSAGAFADLADELEELRRELPEADPRPETEADPRHAAELGDVLFASVNVARRLNVDPELALRAASARFQARVEAAERLAAVDGVAFAELALDEQDRYFDLAKEKEKA